MAKKKWIQSAIKRPGALTKKAKAAGKSISEYCGSSEPFNTIQAAMQPRKDVERFYKEERKVIHYLPTLKISQWLHY
jgi:hypothetical protein